MQARDGICKTPSDQDPITRVAPPLGLVLIFDLAELKEITKYRGGT